MKRFLFIIVLLLSFAIVSLAMVHFKNKEKGARQPAGGGFAVVELFTSEGCSSCPPADEAVAKLLAGHSENVYVLGFHVDYWDRLGWKDEFSNSSYSERQQQYARAFKLGSIYTPQAIVNGKTEFTGSDAGKLNATVNEGLGETNTNTIELSAKSAGGKTVNVSYQLTGASSPLINIALVQLHAQSNVQSGENSGKLLHHVNVVRDFKMVTTNGPKGVVTVLLPAGVSAGDCKIIAYTQDARPGKIMAAAETIIK